MLTSNFDYHLPEELIAQDPMQKRDTSRLLVFKKSENKTQHKHFFDLPDLLQEGDLLVFNNSRVIPARLFAKRKNAENPDEKIEIFLTQKKSENTWEALVKPGRKVKIGQILLFSNKLEGEVLEITEEGMRIIRFNLSESETEKEIENIGNTPLPPYIKNSKASPEQYQTVYAKTKGSVAAPTAGLHFTDDIFAKLKDKNIETTFLTLHVGLGTFAPVKTEYITDHPIHTEFFTVPKETAEKVNQAKQDGRRIIAVGTTSVRTLEACSDENGHLEAKSMDTNIFIYPGYKFKVINGMVTNFHLPKSSLLMLTSAFLGLEKNLEIYKEAIDQKYRFFSFGDACLFI